MKQNILFLTLDGLRADKFTGKTKTSITPNLDKLIKNGTYFSQCISCADGTILALIAMLSGIFPFRSGTRAKEVQMNRSNYIHILKNNGYHIYGIIPDLTVLSRLRFNLENSVNSFKGTPPNIERLWEGTGQKILNLFEPRKMKEPWFCYIHPNDLHNPVIVPEEFNDEKFGNSRYEKVLSSMDKWIGDVVKHIDLDKTIIIITADHGSIIPKGDLEYVDFEPEFKTGLNIGKKLMPHSTHKIGMKIFVGLRNRIRDSRLKKANEGLTPYQIRSRLPHFRLTLFDELIRIPLLFVGKNIPGDKQVSQQVANVDIFPTILDVLELSDNLQRDGRSLIPYFRGDIMEEREVYLHTIPYVEKSIDDKVGIRTPNYKYFRYAREPSENVNLYDLEKDPQENNNIASENPEIVKEMEGILEELTKNATIESMDDMDDKRLERIHDELRLLGYKKTLKENSNK